MAYRVDFECRQIVVLVSLGLPKLDATIMNLDQDLGAASSSGPDCQCLVGLSDRRVSRPPTFPFPIDLDQLDRGGCGEKEGV
jgi:hypothetical protein